MQSIFTLLRPINGRKSSHKKYILLLKDYKLIKRLPFEFTFSTWQVSKCIRKKSDIN